MRKGYARFARWGQGLKGFRVSANAHCQRHDGRFQLARICRETQFLGYDQLRVALREGAEGVAKEIPVGRLRRALGVRLRLGSRALGSRRQPNPSALWPQRSVTLTQAACGLHVAGKRHGIAPDLERSMTLFLHRSTSSSSVSMMLLLLSLAFYHFPRRVHPPSVTWAKKERKFTFNRAHAGVLGADRYSAYNCSWKGRVQYCL